MSASGTWLSSPLVVLPVCYLLGALPFSLLIVRATRGIDLRTSGSGNLGTANSARAAGLVPALGVFAGDVGKGALAMTLALRAFGRGPWPIAALFAVVLGHNFSVFVRFSGGKGLAAAAGALFVLSPWLFLSAGSLGLVTLAATMDFYLASMAMAAGLPAMLTLFVPGPGSLWIGACVAVTVLIRHRKNLAGLWARAGKRGGVGDEVFVLLTGLAALSVIALRALSRGPAGCSLTPLIVTSGRWVVLGIAILAVWALLSSSERRGAAFASGSLAVFVAASAVRAGLAMPSLIMQIGDGSWPLSQPTVAAVAAHHLFWVIGLAAAGLVSRAPWARRR